MGNIIYNVTKVQNVGVFKVPQIPVDRWQRMQKFLMNIEQIIIIMTNKFNYMECDRFA